jgi:alkylhydroperoxidase family enzyme
MSALSFAGSELPVRSDLIDAHERAWNAIASAGTWLTGEQRLAVAAEVRHALACRLCARIKDALSPNAVSGEHQTLGRLRTPQAELVHRVVNDPGRLSESWAQSLLARGLTDGEYIETVSIVAMVMMMDTCLRGLGLPLRALPQPRAGEPSRYRPAGAKREAAWLALVEPQDATPADGPMYPSPKAGYIYRALSLVPQSLRDYWALACAHYLPPEYIYQFDKSIRAISRPQTEIIAARVSAMHQCVY